MVDVITAVVAGIGGLGGGIGGTLLAGMFDLTTTKVEQSAIDERVQSEIYESRRAESLSNLAETASILKTEIDANHNMLNQAPSLLDRDTLDERVHPHVRDYMVNFGKARMYIEDDELEESLESLADQFDIANQYLSQGASQDSTDPSNAPKYNPDDLSEKYTDAIDKLREQVTIKSDWR